LSPDVNKHSKLEGDINLIEFTLNQEPSKVVSVVKLDIMDLYGNSSKGVVTLTL
jgi:hypothetical protein